LFRLYRLENGHFFLFPVRSYCRPLPQAMARIAAALPTPASIVAVLILIATLIPCANAAYVQWIRCPDGNGDAQGFRNVWPTSNRVRLFPSNDSQASGQGETRMEFGVSADYMGKATCIELLNNGPSDVTIKLDALDVSKMYVVRPSNWTCLPYRDRPVWEQKYVDPSSPLIFVSPV
jgi:hypothetical protein